MDIQFSGAVDFQPLIKQLNTTPRPKKSQSNNSYGGMLNSQRSILNNLNRANQLSAGYSMLAGRSINISA
jgi:hypothetical protein